MKKNRLMYLLLILSMGMLLSTSCKKTDDTDDDGGGGDDPSSKKVLVKRDNVMANNASFEVYTFNEDKNVEKETYLNKDSTFLKAVVFKYDASKKMISYTIFLDEALTNIESVTNFTYNASSQITKAVTDAQGAISTNTYIYQSGKLIEANTVYSGSSTMPDQKFEFEWSGDNVSKIIKKIPDNAGTGGFMVDQYKIYTYDDKVNPYYEMKIPRFDLLYLSKNNVTKVEGYDANDTKLFWVKNDYTYDGDYPITGDYDTGFEQGKYSYTYKDI